MRGHVFRNNLVIYNFVYVGTGSSVSIADICTNVILAREAEPGFFVIFPSNHEIESSSDKWQTSSDHLFTDDHYISSR